MTRQFKFDQVQKEPIFDIYYQKHPAKLNLISSLVIVNSLCRGLPIDISLVVTQNHFTPTHMLTTQFMPRSKTPSQAMGLSASADKGLVGWAQHLVASGWGNGLLSQINFTLLWEDNVKLFHTLSRWNLWLE